MTEQGLLARDRRRPARLLAVGLLGAALIAAAVVIGWRDDAGSPAGPPTPAPRAAPQLSPDEAAARPAAPSPRPAPSFDTVRVDPRGEAVIAGHAAPGAEVRIVDGGREVGRVRAGADGAWVLVPDQPLAAGGRDLSLVERTTAGEETASQGAVHVAVPDRARGRDDTVLAGLAAPTLARPAPPAAADSLAHVLVERGQTLWRLARRAYGSGTRYAVLYQANRAQIQDPARIYPGQVLATPGATPGATPQATLGATPGTGDAPPARREHAP